MAQASVYNKMFTLLLIGL